MRESEMRKSTIAVILSLFISSALTPTAITQRTPPALTEKETQTVTVYTYIYFYPLVTIYITQHNSPTSSLTKS